ncbi:hypothetical protein D3C84_1006800 [compost metagenome]
MLGGDENFAADLEQDTGQQRRGQRRGDAFDQALETAGQSADQYQYGAGNVSADRFAVAHAAKAGDQQCSAGCRPGDGHRCAIAQR